MWSSYASLSDVDGGVIEISDGFLGPTLFSVSLQDADSKATESQAGLVFFALSEYGGRWRCRPSETFCRGELDALMRHAKVRQTVNYKMEMSLTRAVE